MNKQLQVMLTSVSYRKALSTKISRKGSGYAFRNSKENEVFRSGRRARGTFCPRNLSTRKAAGRANQWDP